MKLSEARELGYQLRELREGEFYTKDFYTITKLSDNHSILGVDYIGKVHEDELYNDIIPEQIEGLYDGDSWFIHENIPSTYPSLPLPFLDIVDDENLYYEYLESNTEVNHDNGKINSIKLSEAYSKGRGIDFNVKNQYDENGNIKSSVYTANGVINNAETSKQYDNGLLKHINFKDNNIEKSYDVTYSDKEAHITHNEPIVKNTEYQSEVHRIKNIDILYQDDEYSKPDLYVRYDENNEIDGIASIEFTTGGPLNEVKNITSIEIQNNKYNNSWDTDYSVIDIFR